MYPFYAAKSHTLTKPKSIGAHGNYGLFFDRFFQYSEAYDGARFFDEKQFTSDKSTFLNIFDGEIGDTAHIERLAQRQKSLTERQHGMHFVACSDWHVIIGMGNNHPMENGFTWHHTLGVPYLPGSSVKGVLRSYCEQEAASDDAGSVQFTKEKLHKWFGSEHKDPNQQTIESIAGGLVFFDAIPTNKVTMIPDVLTPHTGNWAMDGASGEVAPGDYHTPLPVTFLACKNLDLLFSFAPASHVSFTDDEIQEVQTCLMEAVQFFGIGAKTAAGYGMMTVDDKQVSSLVTENVSFSGATGSSTDTSQTTDFSSIYATCVEIMTDHKERDKRKNEVVGYLEDKIYTSWTSEQRKQLYTLLAENKFVGNKKRNKKAFNANTKLLEALLGTE